jgi:hypothetical protein
MIGIVLAFLFFGFCAAVVAVDVRNFWRLPADAILSAPGGGSKPGTPRRMRMALPSALLMVTSFLVLIGLSAASAAGAPVPSAVLLAFVVLTALAGVLCFTAVRFGVPRVLLLPAFRSHEAYERATTVTADG